MFNKSMVLAVLVASVQLNAAGFDMSNPLSEENKVFTTKLYRATCYAEQKEKREVGPLSNEAQVQLSDIEKQKDTIRSEISGLPQEIKTATFWSQTVNASYCLGDAYDSKAREADRQKAHDLQGKLMLGFQKLDVLDEKARITKKTAPTIFPGLGGMDIDRFTAAKVALRWLVNNFGKPSLSKNEAIRYFVAVIKLGFDEDMIDTIFTGYIEEADRDFGKYYDDPCKK